MKSKTMNYINLMDTLKNLIEQKLALENGDKKSSKDYSNLNKKIETFMNSFSEKELEAEKKFLKQEYDNLFNFYKSGVMGQVSKDLENKLNINEMCTSVINKHLNLKKDTEYSR